MRYGVAWLDSLCASGRGEVLTVRSQDLYSLSPDGEIKKLDQLNTTAPELGEFPEDIQRLMGAAAVSVPFNARPR